MGAEMANVPHELSYTPGIQVALVVKNPSASAGDVRDSGSVPGSGKYPGGGHGNPLEYSCLENSMDRGAWRATVHKVAKSWTQLSNLVHTPSRWVLGRLSPLQLKTYTKQDPHHWHHRPSPVSELET